MAGMIMSGRGDRRSVDSRLMVQEKELQNFAIAC